MRWHPARRGEGPERPAISVVVPLYNKAPYIVRCLESIRRQTWSDFEALVVDDGSRDGGGEIAAGFPDARFRVIRQENRGEGAARNRGIAEAKADVIAFLDADDAWEPLFLEAIDDLRQKYPQAGLLATGYRRRLPGGADVAVTIRPRAGEATRLVDDYFRAVREGDFVTSSSCAVRRAALARVGNFVEGEPIGADRDLWARISIHYPTAYDCRLLAIYHSEAEGRAFELCRGTRRYPPAIRSLRAAVAEGGLSRLQIERAEKYTDWLVLKHARQITYDRDRNALAKWLREERLATRPYRWRAGLLRCLAAFLPLRVVAALQIRPALLLNRIRHSRGLRRGFQALDAWRGRVVVRQALPAHRFETAQMARNTGR